MFKKQKKVELSVEESVNIKLNKEKLARAGFGRFSEDLWCLVINQVTLVPSNLLKLNWEDLKKEILKQGNIPEVYEAIKQRIES